MSIETDFYEATKANFFESIKANFDHNTTDDDEMTASEPLTNVIYLSPYRQALKVLSTKGLRPSLYRLAQRVIDNDAPHPYMPIRASKVER